MTIDEVRAIQRERDLLDVHVVELRMDGFTMAHTEDERAERDAGRFHLDECPIHQWLADAGGMPVDKPGLYTVEVEPVDGYSTSYRSIPYEFKPLASKEEE